MKKKIRVRINIYHYQEIIDWEDEYDEEGNLCGECIYDSHMYCQEETKDLGVFKDIAEAQNYVRQCFKHNDINLEGEDWVLKGLVEENYEDEGLNAWYSSVHYCYPTSDEGYANIIFEEVD